jgi:hypothetical protein
LTEVEGLPDREAPTNFDHRPQAECHIVMASQGLEDSTVFRNMILCKIDHDAAGERSARSQHHIRPDA